MVACIHQPDIHTLYRESKLDYKYKQLQMEIQLYKYKYTITQNNNYK